MQDVTDIQSGKAYDLHSLVHLAIEYSQGVEERATTLAGVAKILAKILPDGEFENWKAWRAYYPHAILLVSNIKEDTLDVATICYKLSWYALEMGNISVSLSLAQRANALRVRLLGEEHLLSLETMLQLAAVFQDLGQYIESEELEVKVLEERRKILGEEHPDTLMAMGNLAVTYSNQKRIIEAEELEVKVLEARRRVLGEEHPDTMTSMANLAGTYRQQQWFIEAEELEARRRILGEEHPNTLMAMANLAWTYYDQGSFLEAEELMEKTFETSKRVLGEDHPDTQLSAESLAYMRDNQKRPYLYLSQAIEIFFLLSPRLLSYL
jgi:tetratricopeptide (TPR) repeat protein